MALGPARPFLPRPAPADIATPCQHPLSRRSRVHSQSRLRVYSGNETAARYVTLRRTPDVVCTEPWPVRRAVWAAGHAEERTCSCWQPPGLLSAPHVMWRPSGLPNKSGMVLSVSSKDVPLPGSDTASAFGCQAWVPPKPGEIWNETPPTFLLSSPGSTSCFFL